MTPCVYRNTLKMGEIISALNLKDYFSIFPFYIKIAMLLNWLETFRLDPVKVA
jgi:hypothetical protein